MQVSLSMTLRHQKRYTQSSRRMDGIAFKNRVRQSNRAALARHLDEAAAANRRVSLRAGGEGDGHDLVAIRIVNAA
jgi:hypothetical protein